MTKILDKKNIVLGVCGGIAAYKSVELLRLLVKQGASVRVIMTRSWLTNFPPFTGSFTIDESTITRVEPEVFE